MSTYYSPGSTYISMSAIETLVESTFAKVERRVGFLDPAMAADDLAGHDVGLRRIVERNMWHHPTREHLYEGAEDILQELLGQGDYITLWTDDYPCRVATSGLEEIRTKLPDEERSRFTLTLGKDKIPLLPQVFEMARANAIRSISIVDNKQANLDKALIEIMHAGKGLSFQLVRINSEAPVIFLPNNFSEPRAYVSLPSIQMLPQVRQERNLWVVDFNHTLVDTNSYRGSMQQAVTRTLVRSTS